MKKQHIMLWSFICLLLSFNAYSGEAKEVATTITNLIVTPEKFHEKAVKINAFVDMKSSDDALLYSSSEYLENQMYSYAIRANKDDFKNISIEVGKPILLYGVFYFDECSDCRESPYLFLGDIESFNQRASKVIRSLKEKSE